MAATSYNVKDISNIHIEEAYRVLRTNIQFCSLGDPIKVVSITSCNPGEGKTTTCINLGISMAKTGMKVLVVDADLRKPMLLKHLSSANHLGLSNCISGHTAIDDIINTTNIENLFFVACGPKPPNPTELLGSPRFSDFLKNMRERFDVIIIDTPPLGGVIDCAIIAAQADAAIIVVRPNYVQYHSALRVKEQLEKVGARVLGVVLNKVEKDAYKGYYNYYAHYGEVKQMDKSWFKKLKKVRR